MGWYAPFTAGIARGERAVCNYDEDSLTLAVSAGMNCLAGLDSGKIDALFVASTTLPYIERMNASIVSAALDLNSEVCAADVTGGLKAGTTAMLSALDAVAAGRSKQALACASDCRLGKPGGALEHLFGDGGAAFLFGTENVIAEFLGSHSVSYDFADQRRMNGDKFNRMWEERWVRDAGVSKILPEAVMGAAQKLGVMPNAIAKLVIGIGGDMGAFAKKMGLAPEQVQDAMMSNVGDCGAAQAGLMLAAALEDAKPGDKIVAVGYGSGADVLLFQVTDAITQLPARRAVKASLANRKELTSYEKYTVWRGIQPVETGIRGEAPAFTALSTLGRDRRIVFGLVGSKCKACGAPQYPKQRVCANPACQTVDKMEPYRFAGRIGKLFTFTGDMLAFSFDPPAIYGLVDMEGGGRLWLDFTDVDIKSMKVEMPVEVSFRLKYYDEGRSICGYAWKAVPAPDAGKEAN
jgi:3-hydroxy-3-methylglutaryl CoA synthase